MDRRTYRTYEPVTLCPAVPGWRALYLVDEMPGWSAQPVAAWGIFRVVSRPVKGSVATEQDEGSHICGVIADGYADSAEAADNFWRYLGPSEPAPSMEEVNGIRTAGGKPPITAT